MRCGFAPRSASIEVEFRQRYIRFAEALNDQPKSSDLLILLATAYERAGKPELAERQYTPTRSKRPTKIPRLHFVTSPSSSGRGDAQRAEDVLVEAISRNPGNLQLISSLGQVRMGRQNWAGMLAVAEAGIESSMAGDRWRINSRGGLCWAEQDR